MQSVNAGVRTKLLPALLGRHSSAPLYSVFRGKRGIGRQEVIIGTEDRLSEGR